jgi:hypothetical protein
MCAGKSLIDWNVERNFKITFNSRICLFEKEELKNIFDHFDEIHSYLDIYEFCTSVQLDLSDDVSVSTSFCKDCADNLISFTNFKVSILDFLITQYWAKTQIWGNTSKYLNENPK